MVISKGIEVVVLQRLPLLLYPMSTCSQAYGCKRTGGSIGQLIVLNEAGQLNLHLSETDLWMGGDPIMKHIASTSYYNS